MIDKEGASGREIENTALDPGEIPVMETRGEKLAFDVLKMREWETEPEGTFHIRRGCNWRTQQSGTASTEGAPVT